MSVNTVVILPDQPAVGQSSIEPLGGDGYSAPRSCAHVDITSTGDASGGTHSIKIRVNEHYQSMFYYLSLGVNRATADVPCIVNIALSPSVNLQDSVHLVYTDVGLTETALQANLMYRPAPIITRSIPSDDAGNHPYAICRIPNEVNQEFRISAMIYQFSPMAREETPNPILVSNFAS